MSDHFIALDIGNILTKYVALDDDGCDIRGSSSSFLWFDGKSAYVNAESIRQKYTNDLLYYNDLINEIYLPHNLKNDYEIKNIKYRIIGILAICLKYLNIDIRKNLLEQGFLANSETLETTLVVPFYFDEMARDLLIKACKIAGFQPLAMLSDIQSAIYNYNNNLIVYVSLGATFKSAIVQVKEKEEFEVLDQFINLNFGYHAVYEILEDYLIHEFYKQNEINFKEEANSEDRALLECKIHDAIKKIYIEESVTIELDCSLGNIKLTIFQSLKEMPSNIFCDDIFILEERLSNFCSVITSMLSCLTKNLEYLSSIQKIIVTGDLFNLQFIRDVVENYLGVKITKTPRYGYSDLVVLKAAEYTKNKSKKLSNSDDLSREEKTLQSIINNIGFNPVKPKALTVIDYINKGKEAEVSTNYDQALIFYKKAIDLDPKSDLAYSGRGDVLCNLNKYDQAVEDYNKVVELKATEVVYSRRAEILYKLGRKKEAIVDYFKIIDFISSKKNDTAIYAKIYEIQKEIGQYKRHKFVVGEKFNLTGENVKYLFLNSQQGELYCLIEADEDQPDLEKIVRKQNCTKEALIELDQITNNSLIVVKSAALDNLEITIGCNHTLFECSLQPKSSYHILGKIYRHKNDWKLSYLNENISLGSDKISYDDTCIRKLVHGERCNLSSDNINELVLRISSLQDLRNIKYTILFYSAQQDFLYAIKLPGNYSSKDESCSLIKFDQSEIIIATHLDKIIDYNSLFIVLSADCKLKNDLECKFYDQNNKGHYSYTICTGDLQENNYYTFIRLYKHKTEWKIEIVSLQTENQIKQIIKSISF